jgi:hypothetical protein
MLSLDKRLALLDEHLEGISSQELYTELKSYEAKGPLVINFLQMYDTHMVNPSDSLKVNKINLEVNSNTSISSSWSSIQCSNSNILLAA